MTEKEREQRTIELTYTGVRYCSGITFKCQLYVPEVSQDTPLGVIVTHDYLVWAEVLAMEKLAKTGDAPYCVCIGIDGGYMSPTCPRGYGRGMRLSNYDFFDSRFADFLVEELIPYLQETYHLNLSKDPNMHMVAGSSSGGISAWNCVWFMVNGLNTEESHYRGIAEVYQRLSGCIKVEFLPYHIYGASKAQAIGRSDNGKDEWIPTSKQMEEAKNY